MNAPRKDRLTCLAFQPLIASNYRYQLTVRIIDRSTTGGPRYCSLNGEVIFGLCSHRLHSDQGTVPSIPIHGGIALAGKDSALGSRSYFGISTGSNRSENPDRDLHFHYSPPPICMFLLGMAVIYFNRPIAGYADLI